jgi:hypothetical protein
MKRYVPFALAIAGVFAALGVLFLLVRVDAWPKNIRAIEWRRAIGTTTSDPVEDE